MPALLHIVTASLRPDAAAGDLAAAQERAGELRGAPGVQAVILGRSEERLVVASWLGHRAQLEPFAASPFHMAFVMRGLAPVVSGMWSAAVETQAAPPHMPRQLWAFAIPEQAGVYEWQVRDFLGAVEALPGGTAAGVTFEERDRYRAAGLVALSDADVEDFAAALPALRARWAQVAGPFEEALVPVLAS